MMFFLFLILGIFDSCHRDGSEEINHPVSTQSSVESLLASGEISEIDRNASSRCTVQDCTCRVYRGTQPMIAPIDHFSSRRQGVYFFEGSSEIDSQQVSRISRFANRHSDSLSSRQSITVIGYTDGCGTRSFNQTLARERAAVVISELRKSIPRARIDTRVVAETVSGHSPEARRVDIIIHTEDSFMTRIERIPADVYLVDGSGSMWSGWRRWSSIVNASVKPGARIYMSMTTGCRGGQTLDDIRPQGGTEIWYSYWWVLDQMSPGETLLIISDFQSNVPLTSSESSRISRKASERGITVLTVR